MSPVKNIMFPVDFSISCVAMSPYVQRAAKLLGATVSLVHVVDPAAFDVFEGYELYQRPMSEVSEEHRIVAQRKLDSFLKEEFPLAECPRILESGDPGTRIGEIARDEEFDLIIIPTHAGRFRQMLLGSTAAKVLDEAPCPVLTSKHAQTIAPRPLEHREWLCAIDLSRYAENVLRTAKRISEQARANLSLIHVVNEESQAASNTLGLEKDRPTKEMREAHEQLMKIANEAGISAKTRIARGPVKNALLQGAAEFDADVLIIGRNSERESGGRLRDLTYAVVRDSPFPVVSV
ncbi:MAG TPA: universal stress protein [Candidatus Saccharimonadales bacterium]|nr:universal stress protein [Candidatus Saccharimonadales bacterium]